MNSRRTREWGWDRARCVEFIAQITSRQWAKSACGFCPFAMRTDAGRQSVIERYRKEPRAGTQALFLEAVARTINERQTLIEGSSVADLVAGTGLTEVQAGFEAMVDECEHAVYEVRRLTRRSSVRPHGRGITARSVRAVARGTREQMDKELRECAGERRVGADGIARHVLRERGEELPALEHFFVVCPAVVDDKARPGFEAWWQEATNDAVLF